MSPLARIPAPRIQTSCHELCLFPCAPGASPSPSRSKPGAGRQRTTGTTQQGSATAEDSLAAADDVCEAHRPVLVEDSDRTSQGQRRCGKTVHVLAPVASGARGPGPYPRQDGKRSRANSEDLHRGLKRKGER